MIGVFTLDINGVRKGWMDSSQPVLASSSIRFRDVG
jgi:hypothetical protein